MAGANDTRLCNFRYVYLEVPTCRIRSGITTYMNLNEIFGIFRRGEKKFWNKTRQLNAPARAPTLVGNCLVYRSLPIFNVKF